MLQYDDRMEKLGCSLQPTSRPSAQAACMVLVKSQIVENAIEHQLKLRNDTISNVAVFAVSQNCISGVAPDGAEQAANDERAKTSANQPKTVSRGFPSTTQTAGNLF